MEAKAGFYKDGAQRRGFVDALVGATVIEYEKNLKMPAIFNTGYRQVMAYCASLLNQGVAQDMIVGVLSDTVRWYAYPCG